MITSETDICNLALSHLGESPITSLNEDSVAARACELHYTISRDGILRAHRWNFAQARVTLSRLSNEPIFGWSHQYELPADFLRALEFNDSEIGDVISEEFIIEGRRLLADSDAVNLVYTRRVSDVSKFDSLFIEAFAFKLAIILSEKIRGTTGKTADLTQSYERVIAPLAKRVDSNEGRRRKGTIAFNSLAIRARGGAGTLY